MTAAASGVALAQNVTRPGGVAWPQGRLVDQGYTDVSPLQTSLRNIQAQLRAPTGFEELFDIGVDRSGETVYARSDGGVTALFPQSIYAPTGTGDIALIPPGTTFVIGSPSNDLLQRLGIMTTPPDQRIGRRVDQSRAGGRLDLRLDLRIGADGGPNDVIEITVPIARSVERPEPRRRGVRALLQEAVDAEVSGGR
ncbi:MAG: hypothetical protein CMJ31_07185 [Phycisphaerae bacterium]|nr:hypothetical protein [Phycisphaerae bacterium]